MYRDPPQRSTGDGQTDVSAAGFLFYFHQRLSSCLMRQMKILCLLFSFVLVLLLPLYTFSCVDKGHILSNLLTLSRALLSCSHHESFHPNFSSLFFCFLFFLLGCVPVFYTGISRLFMLPWTHGGTFSACLFVATGYCDHFFFNPSCLSRGQ